MRPIENAMYCRRPALPLEALREINDWARFARYRPSSDQWVTHPTRGFMQCALRFDTLMLESIDFLRAVSLCILLASVEALHGIARAVLLAPIVGKAQAVKLSIVSGSSLAFVLCHFFVPDVGARGVVQHLALGAALSLFMAAFDVCIGRLVMRFAWARIRRDFDPRTGNYLSIGLFLLALFPSLVWWLRGAAGG